MPKKYNRIKEVMTEQGRTGKWLAEKMGVAQFTVSRWYRNIQQPTIMTLYEIAELLGVEAKDLLVDRRDQLAEGEKGD